MNAKLSRSGALLTALLVAATPTLAQQAPAAPAPASASNAATQATFSQEDLDRLLAPIALYPDALLAQILMASTYPLEVVQAARWSKANAKVSGKALENAMAGQNWDPAVKALTSVPEVLRQMNENLSWTQKLGDAFLAQQQQVMDTVQTLRAKADATGNLKSSEQQVVTTQTQGSQTIYVIESPQPEVIYVPTYNPSVVYGSWWYPTPPYYVYPPAYVYPPGLAFATGIVVGAAIWGACNWGWGRGSVDINVNRYNSFNRTNIRNSNWNHNVSHRRGVAYRDQNVARQYNRGGNAAAARARDDFRGRAATGREELRGMDRAQLNQGLRDGDRGARAATRDDVAARRGNATGGGRFDAAGERPAAGNRMNDNASANASSRVSNRERAGANGFSGVGSGDATRAASQRGHASRADMGNRGGGGFSGGGHFGGGGRGGGGRGR